MSNIVKFTYRNAKGEELILGNFPPYTLLNYSGLGSPSNELVSEKLYRHDGQVKKSSSLNVRDIDLDILIESSDFSERRKLIKNLMHILNPKHSGTLVYEVENEKYELDVDVIKGFEPVKGAYNKGTVQLRALSPHIRNMSALSYESSLSQVFNNHFFPLEITDQYEFSHLVNGGIVKIVNHGESAVGFELRIKFVAPASGVRLDNVYSLEYFAINHTFKAGDNLYLNTKDGELEFLINGENAMSKREINSSFLELDNDGDNYFKLSATNGIDAMIAMIDYEPNIMGVF